MVVLCLIFGRANILFPTVAAPFYILTSNSQGFQYLHLLTSICFLFRCVVFFNCFYSSQDWDHLSEGANCNPATEAWPKESSVRVCSPTDRLTMDRGRDIWPSDPQGASGWRKVEDNYWALTTWQTHDILFDFTLTVTFWQPCCNLKQQISNVGSEMFSHLPKVTQRWTLWAGTQTSFVWLQAHVCSPCHESISEIQVLLSRSMWSQDLVNYGWTWGI